MAPTSGPMEGDTKEIGLTTKCTAEASTPGRMAGNTRVSISMTKSMGMGHTHGAMAEDTSANGSIAKDMEGEKLSHLMGMRDKGYGKTMCV